MNSTNNVIEYYCTNSKILTGLSVTLTIYIVLREVICECFCKKKKTKFNNPVKDVYDKIQKDLQKIEIE